MEITAKATHGAVYHNSNSFFGYCGWPSVCKDDEGTLYAVCSGFRAAHICPFGKTVLYKSWDEGKTWSIPMVINDTYKEIGPHYTVYQSVSEDGGKTWSEMVSLGISGSPPHLLQHTSGAIVLVYGRRELPFGQRALISRDGGETWQEDEYIINGSKTNDIGYPCSVELSDGTILTVYYQHYEDDKYPSVLWSRWEL